MNKYLLEKGDKIKAIREMQFGAVKIGDVGECIGTTKFAHCPGANTYVVNFKTAMCPIALDSCWASRVEKI